MLYRAGDGSYYRADMWAGNETRVDLLGFDFLVDELLVVSPVAGDADRDREQAWIAQHGQEQPARDDRGGTRRRQTFAPPKARSKTQPGSTSSNV